jgi:hypothetical protein
MARAAAATAIIIIKHMIKLAYFKNTCNNPQLYPQDATHVAAQQFMLRHAIRKSKLGIITEDWPRMIHQGDSMTSFAPVQEKLTAIMTAHTDYAKASFEANKGYLEKLSTLKAPDEAIQLTTDHMKSAYETFVAEAKKIGEMYKTFFATAFKPMAL